MKVNNLLLLAFIALFALSACEKDEDDDATPTTNNTTNNNGGNGNNGGGNNGGGSNNTGYPDSLNRMTSNVIQYRDTMTGKDTTVAFSYYFAEDGKVYLHQKATAFPVFKQV